MQADPQVCFARGAGDGVAPTKAGVLNAGESPSWFMSPRGVALDGVLPSPRSFGVATTLSVVAGLAVGAEKRRASVGVSLTGVPLPFSSVGGAT